ncbi:hypothetical protein [Pseudoxanthomonas sp. SE1]|uniref:hypothetical protein n=1 Tax=Pseudoxanthomonas sp. SE1 TaxID=1664560 RepID=UPI00240E0662|nr:hypothetical protein [Pseudoxanthomonas sp. SE1]WFC43759.1 hypothetical protein OY559_09810 [Pseudoxanthomonas sp. SE1]
MAGRTIVPLDGVGTGASGGAFLYVFPCAYEDYAKLGMSKEPFARLSAFAPRYFEFFDLERGWLVRADSVREARQWETSWRRRLHAHTAPPPLLVPRRAAGHTEWLRGAQAALEAARDDFIRQGFTVHASLRTWARERLFAERWRLAAMEQAAVAKWGPIEFWPWQVERTPLAAIRDCLDACRELEVEFSDVVSGALREWHRRSSLLPP